MPCRPSGLDRLFGVYVPPFVNWSKIKEIALHTFGIRKTFQHVYKSLLTLQGLISCSKNTVMHGCYIQGVSLQYCRLTGRSGIADEGISGFGRSEFQEFILDLLRFSHLGVSLQSDCRLTPICRFAAFFGRSQAQPNGVSLQSDCRLTPICSSADLQISDN